VRRVSEGAGVVELGGHVRGVGSAMCRSDGSNRVRAEPAFVLNRRCGDFVLGTRCCGPVMQCPNGLFARVMTVMLRESIMVCVMFCD
jgi:hypothetical protein